MPTPVEVRQKAAASYNAAADRYDDAANSFWTRFGESTVARVGLRPGQRVLDVCCGSGASALPAGRAVGPTGRVLGVDVANELLERARAKAAGQGLAQVEFRVADMLDLGDPAGSFDAVICVFGIFFVPDMVAAVRELWRLTAPGGTLAITTWGPRLFEPMNSVFWHAVREIRPELYKSFNPWDRINDPAPLRALLLEAGVAAPAIVPESAGHPLARADDWWTLVLGSGYRGIVEQLTPSEREVVRASCEREFAARNVSSIEANVLYALATKPR